MTSPRFEYDGRTDEPRPPLRNSTPLLLVMGVGGALLLILLVVGGLVALFVAYRSADPATGKVDPATPVALWDGTVAGDRPAAPGRPQHSGTAQATGLC
jgi:hypothetical protein